MRVREAASGYVAVGGGAVSDDESLEDVTIAESGFVFDDAGRPAGWYALARNTDAVLAHQVFLTVACAKPTQVAVAGSAAARRAARR